MSPGRNRDSSRRHDRQYDDELNRNIIDKGRIRYLESNKYWGEDGDDGGAGCLGYWGVSVLVRFVSGLIEEEGSAVVVERSS